jgi:hypothetical protein
LKKTSNLSNDREIVNSNSFCIYSYSGTLCDYSRLVGFNEGKGAPSPHIVFHFESDMEKFFGSNRKGDALVPRKPLPSIVVIALVVLSFAVVQNAMAQATATHREGCQASSDTLSVFLQALLAGNCIPPGTKQSAQIQILRADF